MDVDSVLPSRQQDDSNLVFTDFLRNFDGTRDKDMLLLVDTVFSADVQGQSWNSGYGKTSVQRRPSVICFGSNNREGFKYGASSGNVAGCGLSGTEETNKSLFQEHVCVFCSLKFPDISELKFHIRSSHFSQNTFICIYCDKSYSIKEALHIHMKYAHNLQVTGAGATLLGDEAVGQQKQNCDVLDINTAEATSEGEKQVQNNERRNDEIKQKKRGRPKKQGNEGSPKKNPDFLRCEENERIYSPSSQNHRIIDDVTVPEKRTRHLILRKTQMRTDSSAALREHIKPTNREQCNREQCEKIKSAQKSDGVVNKNAECKVDNGRIFSCILCKKQFSNKYNMERHFKVVHGVTLKPSKKENDDEFMEREDVRAASSRCVRRKPTRRIGSTQGKRCVQTVSSETSHCGEIEVSKQIFEKKKKRLQKTGRKKGTKPEPLLYSCDICKRKYLRKGMLKRHIKFVHVQQNPFNLLNLMKNSNSAIT